MTMNIPKILLLFYLLFFLGCKQQISSSLPVNSKTDIESQYSSIEIDPCNLIKKDEAIAALESNIVMPTLRDGFCVYSTDTHSDTYNGVILVGVITKDSPKFQDFALVADDTQLQEVSGLGDKAVLLMSKDAPDKGSKAIRVLKGDLYFVISMSPSSHSSVATLKLLAANALNRLP